MLAYCLLTVAYWPDSLGGFALWIK